MTKRDTVILAVLFNVVILACVLATAQQVIASKEKAPVQEEVKPALTQTPSPKTEEPVAFDEIDQLLEEYITSSAPEKVEKTETISHKKSNPSDFYIVCSGDNPWTIAKKFGISFEKLLAINNLDEVSARNLKIGQTIRIREST
jgi:LysM repeat protein